MPMDSRDSSLAPETSATPRDGRHDAQSVGEGVVPVLEVCWDRVRDLRTEWRERAVASAASHQHDALLQMLQLRAVASVSVARVQVDVSPTSKISIPASAAAHDAWELPGCAVRVALPDALWKLPASEPSSTGNDGEKRKPPLMVVVSLQPRRSSHAAWVLSYSLALSSSILERVGATGCRLEVPVCDQDGVETGIAVLRLRCTTSTSTSPPWDDAVLLQHTKQPVEVHVSFEELTRLGERKPIDVVLEMSVTGQDSRHTFRSRSWELGSNDLMGGQLEAAVLHVDDAWTQVIRFIVLQHSPKERPRRLGEGFLSVSEWTSEVVDRRKTVHVVMADVSPTGDPPRRLTQNKLPENGKCGLWGEIKMSVSVRSPIPIDTGDEKRYAAALLSQATGYSMIPTDAKGTLDVEVEGATIIGLSETAQVDGLLNLSLAVTPGKWSAQTTARWTSTKQVGQLTFDSGKFDAPIDWTVKERSIPALECRLTLKYRPRHDERTEETRSLRNDTRTPTRVRPMLRCLEGIQVIHMPVLFACSGEWADAETCLELAATPNLGETSVSARLRLRLRFSGTQPVLPTYSSAAQDRLFHASCHLSFSKFRAAGAFLKNCRPQDGFALELHYLDTKGKTTRRLVSQPKSPSRDSISWKDSIHCDLSALSFAPVIEMRLIKSSGKSEPPCASETVGVLSMPSPQSVFRDQHLVTFMLPLVDTKKGSAGSVLCRKIGTVTFEVQFVSVTRAQHKFQCDPAKLRLQRISWTETPPCLALAMLQRRFSLFCEVSIVTGKALNDVLWHTTSGMLDAVAVSSPFQVGPTEYMIDHAMKLAEESLQKLKNTTDKSVLIIKLSTSEGESSSIALGQVVVPVHGGWANFAEAEKDKRHNVYALGDRRGDGNPEPVGEIQLSVVTDELPVSDDTNNCQPVDGWLCVQLVEAVADRDLLANLSEPDTIQAHVEFLQGHISKSQCKPQFGTSGRWQWEADAVFIVSNTVRATDETIKSNKCSMVLVLGGEYRTVGADIDVNACIASLQTVAPNGEGDAYIDEWVFTADRSAQLRLHIRYLPAISGMLQIEVLRLLPQRSIVAHPATSVPIRRLGLRCLSDIEPANTVTTAMQDIDVSSEDHHQHWRLVEGLMLQLTLSTLSPSRTKLSVLKIQLIGNSVGSQEVCLAEACVPLTSGIIGDKTSTQWIAFYSRHDKSERLAVASLRIRFKRTIPSGCIPYSPESLFKSYDEWQHACSSVLELWKRLFYVLDSDRSGRIDASEFTNLFTNQAKVFRETHDGEILLCLLLGSLSESQALKLTVHDAERLFEDMDRNGDKSIEWNEYVDFLQARLWSLKPQANFPNNEENHPELVANVEAAPTRELRRKRREDPIQHRDVQTTSVTKSSDPNVQKRLSVRQLRSSVREDSIRGDTSSHSECPSKSQTPTDDALLVAKLQTTEALLDLERQKVGRLQEELRILRLAHHQLQIERERNILAEKAKETFVEEAIRDHEQSLQERAVTRTKHHAASIVLQSKVRARLEQKKFQALKLQRWNAALRVQCGYRCCAARRQLSALQLADRLRRERLKAANTLQRFVRFNLRRKERWLLVQARHVSATLLQKYVRRMLAVRQRRRQIEAAVVIQCWCRRLSAMSQAQHLRVATARLKRWMFGRVSKQRYVLLRRCVCQVQRWWRRANELRWEYLTQVEAAMCIQAVWRGCHQRQRWKLIEAPMLNLDEPVDLIDRELLNEQRATEITPASAPVNKSYPAVLTDDSDRLDRASDHLETEDCVAPQQQALLGEGVQDRIGIARDLPTSVLKQDVPPVSFKYLPEELCELSPTNESVHQTADEQDFADGITDDYQSLPPEDNFEAPLEGILTNHIVSESTEDGRCEDAVKQIMQQILNRLEGDHYATVKDDKQYDLILELQPTNVEGIKFSDGTAEGTHRSATSFTGVSQLNKEFHSGQCARERAAIEQDKMISPSDEPLCDPIGANATGFVEPANTTSATSAGKALPGEQQSNHDDQQDCGFDITHGDIHRLLNEMVDTIDVATHNREKEAENSRQVADDRSVADVAPYSPNPDGGMVVEPIDDETSHAGDRGITVDEIQQACDGAIPEFTRSNTTIVEIHGDDVPTSLIETHDSHISTVGQHERGGEELLGDHKVDDVPHDAASYTASIEEFSKTETDQVAAAGQELEEDRSRLGDKEAHPSDNDAIESVNADTGRKLLITDDKASHLEHRPQVEIDHFMASVGPNVSVDGTNKQDTDDSDMEELENSAESDELMLLDATAVTELQRNDAVREEENDSVDTSDSPSTGIPPNVEREDSDRKLLLDLEELNSSSADTGRAKP